MFLPLIVSFQVFKLIYACRLAEAGLSAQAFHYCEVISKTVLQQPAYFSPIFISQIIQVGAPTDQLFCFFLLNDTIFLMFFFLSTDV